MDLLGRLPGLTDSIRLTLGLGVYVKGNIAKVRAHILFEVGGVGSCVLGPSGDEYPFLQITDHFKGVDAQVNELVSLEAFNGF